MYGCPPICHTQYGCFPSAGAVYPREPCNRPWLWHRDHGSMWCYQVFQQPAKTSILVDKHSKKLLLLDAGYNWRGCPYSQDGEHDASMIEGVPPYNISRREFLRMPIVA